MNVIFIFICAFFLLTTVDRASTICGTINLNTEYAIYEDSSLGKLHTAWTTLYDSSWRVHKVNNSFVDVYFINSTDQNDLSLIVNVTGSTDLDQVGDCSGLKNASFVLTCGNSISRNFTVVIQAINDHTPHLHNTVGMITELREDFMVLGNVIDFRDRVEDEDCPEQLLKYSVEVPIDADVNGQDGTKYFDIYDNGTLYVKSELDYETTACGIGGNGLLYLDVVIKDVDENPQTTTVPLTMTVIDIDDEPPQFIDMSRDCIRKCKKCSIKSFIGNVSYENKGDVTVNPQMIAEDIEIVNKSVILYYIRGVYPEQFSSLFTIDINNGSLSLIESFRNATNDTIKDDFSVVLYIQAISNRTLLGTMNVTLNLTVVVPPEITTFQASTMEETTTEEETTTIEQTTVLQTSTEPTSPEVKTTHAPTTAPTMSGSKENDDDLIVIIVPIVAAVLVILLIIVIFANRRAAAAKRNRYIMEKKKNDINGIEKH